MFTQKKKKHPGTYSPPHKRWSQFVVGAQKTRIHHTSRGGEIGRPSVWLGRDLQKPQQREHDASLTYHTSLRPTNSLQAGGEPLKPLRGADLRRPPLTSVDHHRRGTEPSHEARASSETPLVARDAKRRNQNIWARLFSLFFLHRPLNPEHNRLASRSTQRQPGETWPSSPSVLFFGRGGGGGTRVFDCQSPQLTLLRERCDRGLMLSSAHPAREGLSFHTWTHLDMQMHSNSWKETNSWHTPPLPLCSSVYPCVGRQKTICGDWEWNTGTQLAHAHTHTRLPISLSL